MNRNDKILGQIAQNLILQSSFINNIGLLEGKMGIVIFFFHYAKYKNNIIFRRFAIELINEIYAEINNSVPYNFKDGLSGIAWGIEYLIRNNFMKGNPDEILVEIDKEIILKYDVRRSVDFSLQTGLVGISHYVIYRCMNRDINLGAFPKDYIKDLLNSLEIKSYTDNHISLLVSYLKLIINNEDIESYCFLFDYVDTFRYKWNIVKVNKNLGISQNGYAGMGLKLLNKIQHEENNTYI